MLPPVVGAVDGAAGVVVVGDGRAARLTWFAGRLPM
jgi:hypothetical protein